MNNSLKYGHIIPKDFIMTKQVKQVIFWVGALVIGAILGSLHVGAVDNVCDFVATVFTRLFKFTAVPAIAVSVLTTLAALGSNKENHVHFAYNSCGFYNCSNLVLHHQA